MSTNHIRVALTNAANPIPSTVARPRTTGADRGVVPSMSLDDLQARLRELAAAHDVGAIRDGLDAVVDGLDAQAPLVSDQFEVTYVWLIGKLRALCRALDHRADPQRLVGTVNTLATELADALAA